MMSNIAKKMLLFLTFLFLFSCGSKQYTFNEGPTRVSCRANSTFVMVSKPFEIECLSAGDLTILNEYDVGYSISLSKLVPDEPIGVSVIGLGMPRVFSTSVVMSEEYWRLLTGNVLLGPYDSSIEYLDENDPTVGLPPVEGIESSLDGTFIVTLRFFKVVGQDDEGIPLVVYFATSRIRGKLDCPWCRV